MSYLVRSVLGVCLGVGLLWACETPRKAMTSAKEEQPVVIANDSLEYEIIIIDVGFTGYLNSIAKPEGYHSQTYLEIKNRQYVAVWNARVDNASIYDPNIYENRIDYDPHVDYGYDVNYKLFNYFEFAQLKYRMSLR
ncbi:conserved hypothetical protein [Tenacibaculum litopenaei]|uniref:DUF6146 family protein n=1 Tax=Tenacibaculum litopenaei TaxID=396016 RepID=UPI0038937A23